MTRDAGDPLTGSPGSGIPEHWPRRASGRAMGYTRAFPYRASGRHSPQLGVRSAAAFLTSVDRDYDPFGRPDILSVLLTRQG
jgi:hypothetical protein